MKNFSGAIGIIGGVGPYAGLDLMRKIFDQTTASKDQDHLPVIQYSLPHKIADRTDFLLKGAKDNPGLVIGEIMLGLANSGATVLGMPCNTAHSPAILAPALEMLAKQGNVRFIHMIDAVGEHIRTSMPDAKTIGILSTEGTYETRIYQDVLEKAGYTVQFPDAAGRKRVQAAITDPEYGIKAKSNPVTAKAKQLLMDEARALVANGAQGVVLGCTEIPLALTEASVDNVPLIDATNVLGTAIIKAFLEEQDQ